MQSAARTARRRRIRCSSRLGRVYSGPEKEHRQTPVRWMTGNNPLCGVVSKARVLSARQAPSIPCSDPPSPQAGRTMKLRALGVAAAAIVLSTHAATAQATYKRDIPDSLKAAAKIDESVAAKTALARVPKGAIQGVE